MAFQTPQLDASGPPPPTIAFGPLNTPIFNFSSPEAQSDYRVFFPGNRARLPLAGTRDPLRWLGAEHPNLDSFK